MDNLTDPKLLSLVLHALQSLAYGILLPTCRRKDQNGNVFFGPTAVVTTELFKIIVSSCALAYKKRIILQQQYALIESTDGKIAELEKDMDIVKDELGDRDYRECNPSTSKVSADDTRPFKSSLRTCHWNANHLRLLCPAILFVLQNNLQIVSAGFLDATEFQVLSQLRVVSTAVCSVFILKRKLRPLQWISIVVLFFGICILQQSSSLPNPASSIGQPAFSAFFVGFLGMLGASCFSGVASVTMEYMLKGDFEFWSLNLLLATYSIIPASIPIISDCIARGDFQPYRFFNISVWVTIVISALGGILVSMVMKYADNVLKGYSISAALIGTVFINGHFSQAPFSWLRIFGALVIVCSMLLYAQSPKVQNETSPKDEAV